MSNFNYIAIINNVIMWLEYILNDSELLENQNELIYEVINNFIFIKNNFEYTNIEILTYKIEETRELLHNIMQDLSIINNNEDDVHINSVLTTFENIKKTVNLIRDYYMNVFIKLLNTSALNTEINSNIKNKKDTNKMISNVETHVTYDAVSANSFADILMFKGVTVNDNLQQYNLNNLKYCSFCEKYHSRYYFMYNNKESKTLNYCLHCWCWLNNYEINMETGNYMGNINIDILYEKIKKAYNLHKHINCTNNECIINEANRLYNKKKLHNIFIKLFELKEYDNIKKMYKINSKNININYKTSFIEI
jgi:hypothetical protein